MRSFSALHLVWLFLLFSAGLEAQTDDISTLENRLAAAADREKAGILTELAANFQKAGPARAMDYGRRALDHLQRFPNSGIELKVREVMAMASFNEGDFETAMQHTEWGLALAEEIGNAKVQAIFLAARGAIYRKKGIYARALEEQEKALAIRQKLDDLPAIASSFNAIGLIHSNLGGYELALTNYRKALAIRRELSDYSGIASALNNTGVIYNKMGEHDRALDFYLQSLKLKEEHGAPNIATAHNNIGMVYYRLKDFDRALEHHFKSLRLKREAGARLAVAISLGNIGLAYMEKGAPDTALDYFLQSLAIKDQLGNKTQIVNTSNNIGEIYNRINQPEKARAFLEKSLAISSEIGHRPGVAGSNLRLAALNRKTGDLAEALSRINEALAITAEIKAKSLERDCYRELADILAAMGRFERALAAFEKYYDMDATLLNEESSERITRLQTVYTVEKREKELVHLKKDAEIKALQVKRERVMRLVWIMGLGPLFLTIFLIYKRRGLKKITLRERQITQRLKRFDQLKDQFLANTSHELRTPLNGIIGLAESLLDGAAGLVNDKLAAHLDMVAAGGKRLTRMVDDILDFTRLKNRNLVLRKKPVDLYTVVDVVLRLTKTTPGRDELKLVNDLPRDLPPVQADEKRLRQILHNLLDNAVKFTKSGSVRVFAEVANERLTVRVADTGIGIPEDKLNNISESFDRSGKTLKRADRSMGWGLGVTKKLVALHGGTIEAESRIGRGSIFSFTLPISKKETPVKAVIEEGNPMRETSERLTPLRESESGDHPVVDDAALSILVVDDEPVNRRILADFLVSKSYRIIQAASGPEALAKLESGDRFDLVLLDVMMPRMSGYEVCRKLRERASLSALPVIMLTAEDRGEDLTEGFDSGANDYLTKPVAKEELLARVEIHLRLLELNRVLERKVAERHDELKQKNLELDSKNRELETLNHIVKTINREVELKSVVETLLNKGLTLFPRAARGALLVYDNGSDSFKVAAAVGCEDINPEQIHFSKQKLLDLCGIMEEIREGVYRAELCAGKIAMPLIRSDSSLVIAMTLSMGQDLAGFLILDDPHLIDDNQGPDPGTLVRFREHAYSALVKARIIGDLVDAQMDLAAEAHAAGRAEVAMDVLDQVGNIINNVQTSVQVMKVWLEKCSERDMLERISAMIRDQPSKPAGSSDAETLPEALVLVAHPLRQLKRALFEEAERLIDRINDIGAVLQEQHRYTQTLKTLPKHVNLNQVIRETLLLNAAALEEKNISLSRDLGPLAWVRGERAKLIRVFSYLLQNAIEARWEKVPGQIAISTRHQDGKVMVELSDNGVGIPREHLSKVFFSGFTTKKATGGLGLHFCANTVKEMSGSIEVTSTGPGKGTVVRLFFPISGQNPEKRRMPAAALPA